MQVVKTITSKIEWFFLSDLSDNPLNCANCELLQLKLFLQNQTFGGAGATCIGTSIAVVDFNFTDCTGRIPQTHNNSKKINSSPCFYLKSIAKYLYLRYQYFRICKA